MSAFDDPLDALVLSWNGNNVCVRCPVPGCGEIHVHPFAEEFTLQRHQGLRVAKCTRVFPSARLRPVYRLVYPFETHSLTEDVTFENIGDRWVAVGPDIDQSTPSDVDPGKIEDITAKLAQLALNDASRGKIRFDAACVRGDAREVLRLLAKAHEPANLVQKRVNPGLDDPILHLVCSLGRDSIVRILLQAGAKPGEKGASRRNAFEAAVDAARWSTALVIADFDAGLAAMGMHHEALRDASSGSELSIIQCIRQIGVAHVAKRKEEHRLQFVQRLLQDSTATRLTESTHEEQVSRRIDEAFTLHRITGRETIACLSRGRLLPPVVAISGWSSKTPTAKNLLERHRWLEPVKEVARHIGHSFSPPYYDPEDTSGHYHACHAEKQLIAFWLQRQAERPPTGQQAIGRRHSLLRRPLGDVRLRIFVKHPTGPCEDCVRFLDEVARGLDRTLVIESSNLEIWKVEMIRDG